MPIILNRIISIESSRQLTTKYLETYYRASKPFIINTTTLFRFKCPIYDVESEENRSSIIFKKHEELQIFQRTQMYFTSCYNSK